MRREKGGGEGEGEWGDRERGGRREEKIKTIKTIIIRKTIYYLNDNFSPSWIFIALCFVGGEGLRRDDGKKLLM